MSHLSLSLMNRFNQTDIADSVVSFIMPPTLNKLVGHIAFGLSVCVNARHPFELT